MLNIIKLYILHVTQIGMITNHLRICRPCTVHPPALAEPWRPSQRISFWVVCGEMNVPFLWGFIAGNSGYSIING